MTSSLILTIVHQSPINPRWLRRCEAQVPYWRLTITDVAEVVVVSSGLQYPGE